MGHGTIITIGNFDGVHRGHAALVSRAASMARERGVSLRALTFEPHPAAVLRPDHRVPPRVGTQSDKAAWLGELGVDDVVTLEPTRELLSQSPASFVEHLVAAHRPVGMVEGRDFRFGHRRVGDVAKLRELGEQHGFEVATVDPVEVTLEDHTRAKASSSLVRWLVQHGRVVDAAIVLGRAFSYRGKVEQGEQRGRTLGFPTINLHIGEGNDRLLAPADGVYAGRAKLADGREFAAAISVGNKPTFEDRQRLIEAHLVDFEGDVYGQDVVLLFDRWVRDQRRFVDVDELKSQLSRDVEATGRPVVNDAAARVREQACEGALDRA